MFLVSYRADPQAAEVLDTLRRQGVSVLVHSDDFSLTGALVAGCTACRGQREGSDRRRPQGTGPRERLPARERGLHDPPGYLFVLCGGSPPRRAPPGANAPPAWCRRLGRRSAALWPCCWRLPAVFAQLALPALLLYQAAWGVLALAMPLLKKILKSGRVPRAAPHVRGRLFLTLGTAKTAARAPAQRCLCKRRNVNGQFVQSWTGIFCEGKGEI